MKKFITGLTLLTAVMSTACHFGPEKRANWITSKINGELDLNSEQKAKLEAVKKTYLDLRRSHLPEQEKNLEEAKKIILADKLDASKMKALMAQRDKAMNQDFDLIFSKASDFHSSLTAEQKKKAVKMMEDFFNKWNKD